ncbi:MAG: ABC transporter permease [Candidatus Pacebacteria bacterium]|nr:ABC transporter permease [Candidatus Paceibacterota bacterium]
MIHKILIITWWEFIEKVKKKSFLIYMLVFPIILIGLGILPTLLNQGNHSVPLPIGILDPSERIYFSIRSELENNFLENGQPRYLILNLNTSDVRVDQLIDAADKKVTGNFLAGYLFIRYTEEQVPQISYRSNEFLSPDDLRIIEDAFNISVTKLQLIEAGVNYKEVNRLIFDSDLIEENVSGKQKSKEEFIGTFLSSYILIMLLLIMILFSGGMLVRSLLEEKSTRLIEVILSSVKVTELIAGKMMGLSLLGIFQLSVWFIIGIIFAGKESLNLYISPHILLQLVYFFLGYLLYASIFIGIGSIVSTEHEAQQLTGFLSLLLIVPIIVSLQIIQNPDSLLSIFLSYFPLTSAPIMLLRLNIYTPPLIDILLTILILVASIYAAIKLSGKIFNMGIHYYGKRPSLKELKSWLQN